MRQRNENVRKLVMTGLMAALSYVVFTFLQIKVQFPGGGAASLHLGNAVCVLGALLLGGFYGGLGGAIGMAVGDLLDPVYVIYVPKTMILKLCIGLITGLIAHRLGKITKSHDRRHVFIWTTLAAAGGLLFNAAADPLVSYFYQLLLLGKTAAEVSLVWNVAFTAVNSLISIVVSVAVYMALRPALKKSGLFFSMNTPCAGRRTHRRSINA